jgi:hypothetical protein
MFLGRCRNLDPCGTCLMDIEDLKTENIRLRKALTLAELSNGGLLAKVRALEHRSKRRMKTINDLKRKYQQAKKDLLLVKALWDGGSHEQK